MNIMLLGFLVFARGGRGRRVAAPAAALRASTWSRRSRCRSSFPVGPQPLMSLPRFLAVLFPIFMWLAVVCEERRSTEHGVALSAIGLGLFTAQFATWHFIA